ncbi:MAG: M20/M25/M40 family metallo-hydrolase [Anaerolineaceae bacterium]|nr:M20/M25/M40 family metallo-hydrolase [Anaerolineaceae bacterium]
MYERIQKVFDYIDEHKDEFVADLQTLLRQPSVAAQNHGVEECADLVIDLLKKDGIEAEKTRIDGAPPIIYADIKTSDADKAKTVVCYGHYDVQPVEPLDEWHSDPWGAEIKDGIIYGRGATDNKGGVMAFSKAVRAYQEVLGEVPVNLKFLFEGEEEIGSPHLETWCLRNTDRITSDGMFCLDGDISASAQSPHIDLGLKAILYVELIAEGPKSDVYSGDAAWVVNPAWRLVQALNTLVDAKGNILIDGWYDEYEAPNDVDEEMLKRESARIEVEKVLEHFGIKELPWGKTPYELMKARQYGGTCTICGIKSGYIGEGLKTIVPSTATVKIDFRLPAMLMPEKQLKKLRTHLKKHGFNDIRINPLVTRGTPYKTAYDSGIAQAIIEAADHIFGSAPVVSGMTQEDIIRSVIEMPIVITGFGPPHSNLHAPNENMPVDSYIRGIKYAAAIMESFAQR